MKIPQSKILLFLFLIGLGSSAFAQSSSETIKILSYNIFHGENPNHQGVGNLEEIAALISELQPDLVAMQEVDSMTTRSAGVYGEKEDLMQKLAELTGYTGYFAKAMDFAEGGYGEGLLVKGNGKFETQNLPLPGGGEPRAAAWVTYELPSGKKIKFAGTHLCHQFEENRIAQVEAVSLRAKKEKLPTIWAGDLNLKPDSKAYKSIKGSWKDAGASPTPYSPTYGTMEDGARIDYVWFDSSKFTLVDYQVLNVLHSDHYPVLVTLQLK
ncbi:endonuclease/exonuclease/phosphatase family metal-dependent hydrolase [Algoriphagus iocasae]|uniref:Endonuclease/exonuclease/phosphatase family metal-dependent hydrolase n=1 Tax=Algoriphagus iocasae TaxID=1836499 RepID=A0A841MSU2_9BACT|nr:endonuclease/exonuclease/phosphatase family protein [Algoriphagus iocasae]MBB6325091.1 endonuclease/exonuclease/phosphatase family metal-dependent hydrolase [Algoriphagus iocasae]